MVNRTAIIMACLLVLTGCEYENEEALFGEPEECTTPVLFESEIRPLIQANCAFSGCHAAGGTSPELTTFELVQARATDIRHMTQSRQMPPPSSGRSLSQEEIDKIACWVEQGAHRE